MARRPEEIGQQQEDGYARSVVDRPRGAGLGVHVGDDRDAVPSPTSGCHHIPGPSRDAGRIDPDRGGRTAGLQQWGGVLWSEVRSGDGELTILDQWIRVERTAQRWMLPGDGDHRQRPGLFEPLDDLRVALRAIERIGLGRERRRGEVTGQHEDGAREVGVIEVSKGANDVQRPDTGHSSAIRTGCEFDGTAAHRDHPALRLPVEALEILEQHRPTEGGEHALDIGRRLMIADAAGAAVRLDRTERDHVL